ncbi:GNAT superfamily N-acetyltransferase [Desulfitispora alkaliphila]|uniref:GNAT family N-acetyltransferase n=1 Tax=Desulfitispora alkaliphila TaxID=622674 RepID=UPI003D2355EE
MDTVRYEELTSPHSFDYKEAMFYCQLLFNLSRADTHRVLKHLLIPKKLAPNRFFFVVAKKGDQLVGFSLFYYLQRVNLGYLDYIAVLPEYRGEGIGVGLYQKTVSMLEEHQEDVYGMLFEVHQAEGLEMRKDFFRKQGAVKLDLSKYKKVVQDTNLEMMFHSFNVQSLEVNEIVADNIKGALSNVLL